MQPKEKALLKHSGDIIVESEERITQRTKEVSGHTFPTVPIKIFTNVTIP